MPGATSTIKGILAESDGTPMTGISVKAFRKGLKTEEQLGETSTGVKGDFAIEYAVTEGEEIDIIIRAYGEDKSVISSSDIIFNARKEVVADLIVGNEAYKGPSEYQRLEARIAPLLGNVKPGDLSDDDLRFLARKTKIDSSKISDFLKASRFAQTSASSPEIYYGLLRKGLSSARMRVNARIEKRLRIAVANAAAENIISEKSAAGSDAFFQSLRNSAIRESLNTPPDNESESIGSLFTTMKVPPKKQEKLLDAFSRHEGSNPEFWTKLRMDPDFKEGNLADKIQFSFHASLLTQNHLPLIHELQSITSETEAPQIKQLVEMDAADWEQILKRQRNGKIIGAPQGIEGKTDDERISNYARVLERSLESAYPMEKIAGQIRKSEKHAGKDIQTLFNAVQDFDFATTNIDSYMKNNAGALTGVKDPGVLGRQLKGMQRIYRLSPQFGKLKAIETLMEDKVDSAFGIRRLGKNTFTKKYSDLLGGESEAIAMWSKVSHTAAMTLNLYTKLNELYGSALPGVIKVPLPDTNGLEIPDLKTLFGSQDYCECEHCRSVYSPAAYLVDLLGFLRREDALDSLFDRRPDLGEIELSCENTNTPLPYVDLVNEILENAALKTKDEYKESAADGTYQTTYTADELRANPENMNGAAYDLLAEQVYPFNLPFSQWNEEARVYLDHIGIKRHELMETFQFKGASGEPSDIETACEHLKISSTEKELITGGTSQSAWELWGMEESGWTTELSYIETFQDKTGLEYEEIRKLLQVAYVNPGNVLSIDFSEADSPCDLSGAKLIRTDMESGISSTPTGEDYGRIQRFLRIWKKLDWNILDTNEIMKAIGTGDIDESFIIQLSNSKLLHNNLKIPIVELAGWWASISTEVDINDDEDRSYYEQLFLNKSVMNPVEEIFELNESRTELASTDGLISDFMPSIAAALNISSADLSLLAENLSAEKGDSGKKITLENLSYLFRAASLSKALDIQVEEYLTLRNLIDTNPFDAASIKNAVDFYDGVETIKSSGFKINELDYLFRHVYVSSDGIAPSESSVLLILEELRRGLESIAAENTFASDPTGDLTKAKLAVLFANELLNEAIAIIEETSNSASAEQETFIDENFTFIDTAEAKEKLIGAEKLENLEDRFECVLEPLLEYLSRYQSESFMKQNLSGALGLDLTSTDQLLNGLALSPEDSGKTAADVFLDDSFIYYAGDADNDTDITSETFPSQFKMYILLQKMAVLISSFDISYENLSWIFLHGPAIGWIDFNKLPLEPEEKGTDLFASWERLVDYFNLDAKLPAGDIALFDILNMVINPSDYESEITIEVVLDVLLELTNWEAADLAFLTGTDAYNLSLSDFGDERALVQLKECMDAIGKIGMPAEEVWGWKSLNLDETKAKSIKQAAKAKYNNEEWLTVAKPLRNELREMQRQALVSYMITQENFEDESDLFGYYLIDVEMSPCMMTSRIKQANSSVQLYIQRCFLNLESGAAISEDGAEEWEWMKNYRVWEANRKVFLYPENWIEPELRDNQSEFFEDLHNELLQNDVTEDTAETAFLNYLEKLDAVSNIDICGMYYQYEDGGEGEESIDVLHVVGRTQSDPHTYYYRQRVDASYWTPWEKINLDIETEHVMPVVINRRLFIFWPVFKEISTNIKDIIGEESLNDYVEDFLKVDDADEYIQNHYGDPFVTYEIKLAYSEYKEKKWLPKKQSKEFIYSDQATALLMYLYGNYEINTGDFCFYAQISGYEIKVQCIQTINFVTDEYDDIIRLIQGTISFDLLTGKITADDEQPTPFPYITFNPFDWELIASILTPESSHLLNNNFVEDGGNYALKLLTADRDEDGEYDEVTVLNTTPGIFKIPIPYQYSQFYSQSAFFFEDDDRAFLVVPEEDSEARSSELLKTDSLGLRVSGVDSKITLNTGTKYRFLPFYHPYVAYLIKILNRDGIEALMERDVQLTEGEFFESLYAPENVLKPYPISEMDFLHSGAYSLYNWELFFHIPLLIADRLSKNQQFEDAQKWFHFIFNPTDRSEYDSPQKYWQTKPFFQETSYDSIYDLMMLLQYSGADSEMKAKKNEVINQIEEWRDNPFDPHTIAQLRPVAYQKTVVMKYIDNLIQWGDYYFSQDTIESINEATQLYLLAAAILGDRPEEIPSEEIPVKTYNELQPALDEFSNALVTLENYYSNESYDGSNGAGSAGDALAYTLYFCIPNNENLLKYWDTVEDRLFKIRNCMNIEGVVRQLALFEPPIDPGLLVKARAAGVDIGSALSDINAPVPYYRFRTMLARALDFCTDVRQLGNQLLAALEKRDAESLSLLRGGLEIELLNAIQSTKELQIEESGEILSGLEKSKEIVEARYDYYKNIEKMIPAEIAQITLTILSGVLQAIGQGTKLLGAAASLTPDYSFGAAGYAGSPVFLTHYGGSNVARGSIAFSDVMMILSSLTGTAANVSATFAGFQRRWNEWKLQEKLAGKEMAHIDKQIAAAKVRVAIWEKELENHEKQIENARDVEDFMESKFTNKELYDWMVSQICTIYFQSYQMAFDLAKRAQKAYQYELGSDKSFIQFGYWDSLKKGLLAGEKLHYDLKRMELSYLDQNKRVLEITKNISLAVLDPLALIMLKETGECYVEFPEVLFDLDYPGHYLRRIKSVSLTIPCVAGPYTNVNCTLTLLENKWRNETGLNGGGYAETEESDSRFIYNQGVVQSIATSGSLNDSGMFRLDFADDRYLPFEGSGAISRWKLEMPLDFQSFDYNTISDVIFTLSYTAKNGGETLKSSAKNEIENALTSMALGSDNSGLTKLLTVRHEFSNEWYRFLHPLGADEGHSMTLSIDSGRFPYIFRKFGITINRVELIAVLTDDYLSGIGSDALTVNITPPGGATAVALSLASTNALGGHLYGSSGTEISGATGDWLVAISEDGIPSTIGEEEDGRTRLNSSAIRDFFIIAHYAISE